MSATTQTVQQAALDTAEDNLDASPKEPGKASGTAAGQQQQSQQQQQQPMAQLVEDEGLNAELSAANTGGLVETERDRLIRIVSDKLTGSSTRHLHAHIAALSTLPRYMLPVGCLPLELYSHISTIILIMKLV